MSLNIEEAFFKFATQRVSKVTPKNIVAVLELGQAGNTVPFIARYRKEKTGNLDEVQILGILDLHAKWVELKDRKIFVLDEIAKQGSLTEDLKKQIEASEELSEVEELYRPYKKKKKTKAKLAKDAGIEPLADWIWALGHNELQDTTTLEVKAKDYINPAAGYATYEEVLRGAQHIIVEKLANMPDLRIKVKDDYFDNAILVSEKTTQFKVHSKFDMYGDYKEPVRNLRSPKASHRYLAVRRGWQEGELKVSLVANDEMLLGEFYRVATQAPDSLAHSFLQTCANHALTIHVIPSIVNELHSHLKDLADEQAIQVFAENVRRVLMGSPFGAKVVLGVDPGLRTGCKVSLIDKGGHFISHTVVQILGEQAFENAKKLFGDVFNQIKIDAVAVGNGTGGREAEAFFRKLLKELGKEVPVVLISESGASVYSASEIAREEFPELDLTVRGAISIARRLQDPLAELVKVDPKSIGVGQYQHDVSQSELKKSLSRVVESCVNQVGVDLNTASESLLQYVSGIGPAIAKNIVAHRKTSGLFQEREELLKVGQFSSKTFEQAAGFLRIQDAKNILDRTGIHPERYSAVKEMAHELGVPVSQLMGEGATKLLPMKAKWSQLIGEFTFDDIVKELQSPSRDPRDPYKVFQYREDIHELKDLKAGLICPGLVTNVTNFGAFVDIGVHQDGLVHISELSDEFVSDPKLVVKPGDQVQIRVLAVDLEKKQISLSMKLQERKPFEKNADQRGDQRSRPQEERPRSARPPPRQDRDNARREPRREFQSGERAPSENRGPRPQRPENSQGGKRADFAPNAARGERSQQRPTGDRNAPESFGAKDNGRPMEKKTEARPRRENLKVTKVEIPKGSEGDLGLILAKSSANSGGLDNRGRNDRPRHDNRNRDNNTHQRKNQGGSPFNNPFAALSGVKNESSGE